jgi:hypothetical protein
MKFRIFAFLLLLYSCHSSNDVKNMIKGNWFFEDNSDVYIKITNDEFIVKNDSPYPEDYKIIGDTLIVKGFEAAFRESANELGYIDTLKIENVTKSTLILKSGDQMLVLQKK